MRTAKMNVAGQERLLCFSARVVRECTERYGGIEHLGEQLSGQEDGKNLSEAVWLLAQMLDAGDRYAKLTGQENPAAPTYEDLYDLLGPDDFAGLRDRIAETISVSGTATVSAAPPKNAGATPGDR